MKNLLLILLLFSSFISLAHGDLKKLHQKSSRSDQAEGVINLDSKKRLSVGFGLSIGSGPASMSWDIVQNAPGQENTGIIRREYKSSYSNFYFDLKLGYSFKNLTVGLVGIASTNKANDLQTIIVINDGTRSNLPFTNEDWPNSKFFGGLFVEYDCHDKGHYDKKNPHTGQDGYCQPLFGK